MDTKKEETDERNTEIISQLPGPVLQQMHQGEATRAGVLQQPSNFGEPELDITDQANARHGGPAPQQPQSAQRVPIPPQSDKRQSPKAATSGGPMSRNVTIPPRPRPGRKPIPQEEAADKRRVQNRIAQRNFRDKRQQKLVEALAEIEDNKRGYEEEVNRMKRENDRLRRQVEHYVNQCEELQKQKQQLQQQQAAAHNLQATSQVQQPVQSTSLGQINTNQRQVGAFGASSVPTPPEDVSFPNEIDFTAQYSRGGPQTLNNSVRPTTSSQNTASLDFEMGLGAPGDRCGFCTDDQNCSCRAEKTSEPCGPIPGSCEACRRDPARAEMCRELASATHMATRPSTSDELRLFDHGSSSSTAPTRLTAPSRVSCSNFIDQFGQLSDRAPSISDLFNVHLQAYPAANGGFEIEEQEAAQALHSLSRRNTVIPQAESNDRSAFGERSRRGNL